MAEMKSIRDWPLEAWFLVLIIFLGIPMSKYDLEVLRRQIYG